MWPFQTEWPEVNAVVAATANALKAITAAMRQATMRFVCITGSFGKGVPTVTPGQVHLG